MAPMHRLVGVVALLACGAIAIPSPAFGQRPVPRYARVVDETGRVDAASAEAVARITAAVHGRGGPNLAVIVVRSLSGEPVREFGRRVYGAWHLGRPDRDDGILLVIACDERVASYEVGAALEGIVDRGGLESIIQRTIGPRQGDENLGPALVEAVQATLIALGAPQDRIAEPYRIGWDRAAVLTVLAITVPILLKLLVSLVVLVLEAQREQRRRKDLERRGIPVPPPPAKRPSAAGPFIRIRTREQPNTFTIESYPSDPRLWFVLVAFVAFPLIIFGVTWSRGVDLVVCSHATEACRVSHNGKPAGRLPLSRVRRFEVWDRKDEPTLLVAVTPDGNALLVEAWPAEELRTHAVELNRLLDDARADDWTFVYDHRRKGIAAELIFAGFFVLLSVGGWALGGPWKLTLDRARALAVRKRPFWRTRRPLTDFTGVQVWTPRAEEVEKYRRLGRPFPYASAALDLAHLVLLGKDGKRWPVTRWGVPGGILADFNDAAARVGLFLGLPIVAVPEPPPPGTVPPPHECSEEGRRAS